MVPKEYLEGDGSAAEPTQSWYEEDRRDKPFVIGLREGRWRLEGGR